MAMLYIHFKKLLSAKQVEKNVAKIAFLLQQMDWNFNYTPNFDLLKSEIELLEAEIFFF